MVFEIDNHRILTFTSLVTYRNRPLGQKHESVDEVRPPPAKLSAHLWITITLQSLRVKKRLLTITLKWIFLGPSSGPALFHDSCLYDGRRDNCSFSGVIRCKRWSCKERICGERNQFDLLVALSYLTTVLRRAFAVCSDSLRAFQILWC